MHQNDSVLFNFLGKTPQILEGLMGFRCYAARKHPDQVNLELP